MINRNGKDFDTNIVTDVLQTTFRVNSINRYNLLTGMITRLLTTTLLIASIFSPLSFLPSIQAQTLTQTKVDVHCHLFNAQDMPLQGMVEKFLKGNAAGLFIFQSMAASLLSETPGFVGENKVLNQLLNTGGLNCMRLFPRPSVFPVLNWLKLLKHNRFNIACELVNTYPDVNLFTPAILDYDHWLSDNNKADKKADTTISEQIILYEKIVRLFEGKIHPLISFNPLKEIYYEEDIPEYQSLKWVKEAVEQRGFIGVKLYPPMGFYPINNSQPGRINPSDPFYEYRVKIDEVLENLYKWCVAEDVPIMVHCGNNHGSRPGYGDRANPEYWKDVLLIYPELRLNFGHFGTDEEVRMANHHRGWAWKIAELMNDYRNVYADTGYHEVVLPALGLLEISRRIDRDEYIRGLDELFSVYAKVEERLMYGSDMHVLMVQFYHEEYLNKFEGIFNNNFPYLKDNFLGQNALRFFGLDDPGTKNRQRLLEFYEKHNMAKPQWWVGSWLPQPPPATPTNLQATAVSPSKIILCWDASSDNVGVKGYNIFRRDVGGGFVQIGTTIDTIYQDTGLSASTAYDYKVSAFDSADSPSPQSAPDSATTL